jgi:hypothetical protein
MAGSLLHVWTKAKAIPKERNFTQIRQERNQENEIFLLRKRPDKSFSSSGKSSKT